MLGAYRFLGVLGVSLGFLVPATINFANTISLGSVLLALLGVGIAGIFTIRSRIATIWRQEAEGERASRIRVQGELAEAQAALVKSEHDQRELRHALKNEIIGLNAQLKVMEAKTDLTAALEAIHQMNEASTTKIVSAMDHNAVETAKRDGAMLGLLAEIRDNLTPFEQHVAKKTEPGSDRRR